MAWIVLDLDKTLVNDGDSEGPSPEAVEAMQQLAVGGHRLTVYTSRFAPMPASEKQRVKETIESELVQYGFPPMEVWTGTTKPDADIFIGRNHIPYDGDWGLVLAQVQVQMQELGVAPAPQPDDGSQEELPPQTGGEEMA